MLTGCAQDLIFSDVNRDTVEVLARNGCEVLHRRQTTVLRLASRAQRRMGHWPGIWPAEIIDQFPPAQFDAIITNAAGCGSHLKHYATLLEGRREYHSRAEEWDRKVKDIHEWLADIGIKKPSAQIAVKNP